MAIRPVLRMGHPVLRRSRAPVERFGTPELRELVRDMDDTMRSLNGAGIAAPQIGVSLRVVIFEVIANPRYPQAEAVPYTVLVNPTLEPLGTEQEDGWEGCLSVPGPARPRAAVSTPALPWLRPRRPADRPDGEGFHARVVQHEVDHLDGILYPMRIADLRNLGFEDVLFPDARDLPPD